MSGHIRTKKHSWTSHLLNVLLIFHIEITKGKIEALQVKTEISLNAKVRRERENSSFPPNVNV